MGRTNYLNTRFVLKTRNTGTLNRIYFIENYDETSLDLLNNKVLQKFD